MKKRRTVSLLSYILLRIGGRREGEGEFYFHGNTRAITRDEFPVKRLHIRKHKTKALPHFLAARQDLARRQDEATVSRVPQLDRHAVVGLGNLGGVVDAVAADLVDGAADGASGESGAVHSFDSADGAIGQGGVLGGIGDGARASITIGKHPQLAVGMNVHVELDAVASSQAIEMRLEGLGFHAIASRGSLVVLVTGRRAGTAPLVPVIRPVAVDIATDAA